jgi:hypothetical protein
MLITPSPLVLASFPLSVMFENEFFRQRECAACRESNRFRFSSCLSLPHARHFGADRAFERYDFRAVFVSVAAARTADIENSFIIERRFQYRRSRIMLVAQMLAFIGYLSCSFRLCGECIRSSRSRRCSFRCVSVTGTAVFFLLDAVVCRRALSERKQERAERK